LSAAARTVSEVLRAAAARLAAAGNHSARLDAEVLLAALLGVDRAGLVLRRDELVEPGLGQRYSERIERRCGGEPVAYLTGEKEFFSLPLAVDRRVLIPRPETEQVVEVALRLLADELRSPEDAAPRVPRVVDVGTGSGAIAVALGSELRRRPGRVVEMIAVDRSGDALAVARTNTARHLDAHAVRFVRGDLTGALRASSVALVVANPPYLSADDLRAVSTEVAHEPVAALLGGGMDGGEVVRELLTDATRVLEPGGYVVSEIGWTQGGLVEALARDLGFEEVRVLPDLAGHDRVLVARWRREPTSR
jgi:release factor glutamine methyltransferase